MALAKQLVIVNDRGPVTETDAERDAEAERQISMRIELMGAIRAVVREMGGNDEAAKKLDSIWGRDDVGRGVSGSTFKACLGDTERNYFRLEWVIEMAARSEVVGDLLRRIADGRSEIPLADQLQNMHEIVRKKYPEDAADIIRKAKNMRPRR